MRARQREGRDQDCSGVCEPDSRHQQLVATRRVAVSACQGDLRGLHALTQRKAIMPWIYVMRVIADHPPDHEPVLLNSAYVISREQLGGIVYVSLYDGRHFAVAESLEALCTAISSSST